MTVEVAQFINGLNPALPTGASDPITEGDNHLRLIKGAILATFPAIAGQVTATHADLSSLTGAATTGANGLNVVTQAATNNGTLAASTAQVQGAIGVAIAPLAPLLSPVFVGTPTAPTATAGTVSGQLATTAFAAALNIVGTAAATASAIASASTATNAAASSAISAGAVIWVTGSTYAVNARVISPSNGRVYMSLAAGVSNTDPASDTRWLLVTTNRVAVAITAATITAISGTHYVMTNAAQSILTLPASPVTGSILQVTFTNARTDNVIARNGSALLLDSAGNPLLEDMTVDVLNRSVILEYAFNAWRFYLDSTAVASSAVVVTVTQATDAATTATAAAAAATTTQTAINNKYRGALALDPATRPDSTANQVGDEYFSTTINLLKRYNGLTWLASDINTANLAASTGAGLVGFVQAGTGAVARTVQDKTREVISVKDFGAVGDGVADDSAKIVLALQAAAVTKSTLFFPVGVYRTTKFTVPLGVSMRGASAKESVIKNISTNGGVFIAVPGSRVHMTGLTIDGSRALQPEGVGLSAIQFAKTNNLTGGGTNIAGGLALSAAVSVGATTISANNVLNLEPGDAISLWDTSSNVEVVRVKESYIAGNLSISLQAPTLNAYSTAAKVAIYSTDAVIDNCIVFGCGRDGIAFYHAHGGIADKNFVFDCEDTAIDSPDGGNRMMQFTGNTIETNGRWGISFDNPNWNITWPTSSNNLVLGNTIKFINGGVNASGTMINGIFIGGVEHSTFSNNAVDISRGGVAGIRFALQSGGQPNLFNTVIGNSIIGKGTTGTYGVLVSLGSSTIDLEAFIGSNTIKNVDRGIDVDGATFAMIIGNILNNTPSFGINANRANALSTQRITVIGNIIDTCVAGVRFGGTSGPSSRGVQQNNIVRNFGFAAITYDTGWLQGETNFVVSDLALTGAAPPAGAGVVTFGSSTTTAVGAAGSAGALPSAPLGYLFINVAGVAARIPYYN